MEDRADSSSRLGATVSEIDILSRPPIVRMTGIVKRFAATTALNAVNLELFAGEIHALLGENGAGKSTLMHVLSGLTRADSGEVLVEGNPIRLTTPRDARVHGIAMVHQHFTLAPAFTVAENLALEDPSRTGFARFWKTYSPHARAAAALERASELGWKLDPNAVVADLPVGLQQRVEIIKALASASRIVIFDEPTAVLAGEEVAELFQVLRRLRAAGCAVVLIAHKLAEILAVADRVTVLRRGVRVASCLASETNAEQLALWMVGDTIRYAGEPEVPDASSAALNGESMEQPSAAAGQTAFRATDLTIVGYRGVRVIEGISLSVRRGEIFGVGGVDGNGQSELAEVLAGIRTVAGGTLQWENGLFKPGLSPSVGYIPQDRRRDGLATSLSVEENLLFDAIQEPEFRWGPFLRRSRLRRLAADLTRDFDIRTSSLDARVSTLSGGNQQKIVVARALRSMPDWIVAVNPTRGLDIAATRFVHAQLRRARARGAAITLISTDLEEIDLLADRAGILSGGHLVEYRPCSASGASLGLMLGGIAPTSAPDAPAKARSSE